MSVFSSMFLDVDIDFDRPGRIYHPGDVVTCKIYVESTFNITCKYIKVRFCCPYDNKEDEYFRLYKIARQRISMIENVGSIREEIGPNAEDIVLRRGRNRFIVACQIPKLSDKIFEKHSEVLRCSCKVAVKTRWLPKRLCKDWFVIEPKTATEEVIEKVENGAAKVFTSLSQKFRNIGKDNGKKL